MTFPSLLPLPLCTCFRVNLAAPHAHVMLFGVVSLGGRSFSLQLWVFGTIQVQTGMTTK